MEHIFKSLLMERRKILKSKGYDLNKDYTFNAYTTNGKTVEEKKYNDISHVNYWLDKDGNPKWKIYMMDGEELYLVDNSQFCRELCPIGANVVSEVINEESL